jgi:hypothetical protein
MRTPLIDPKLPQLARKFVDLFAVIAGITGVTLTGLQDSHPIWFAVLCVLVVALTVLAFLSWHRWNVYTRKQTIDTVWATMLSGATHTVRAFAGDASWSKRDAKIVASQTGSGVSVEVLCRPPSTNVTVQENVIGLIEAGATVFFYPTTSAPVIRGLLIDSDHETFGTALTVSKSAKGNLAPRPGLPGTEEMFDYLAVRYVPSHDRQFLVALNQLFECIVRCSCTGIVLRPLDLTPAQIRNLLLDVPHYSGLADSDVCFRNVDISSVSTPCNYVKESKIGHTLDLLNAYEQQGIPSFQTCLALSHDRRSLILPPILERHGDKLILIDGMHRLFCQLVHRQVPTATCLVIDKAWPLPGDPIPLAHVQVWPRRRPRPEGFHDYKEGNFRNIDALDDRLRREYPAVVQSTNKRGV